MAWFRAFFYKLEIHSWLFNFHGKPHSHFPLASIISGPCSVVLPLSYCVKLRINRTSAWQIPILMIPMQKKLNFSEPLTLLGFSAVNIDTKIIFLTPFPCQSSKSIRADGGMSTKHNSGEKKMWSIFVKQNQKIHSLWPWHLWQTKGFCTWTIYSCKDECLFVLYKISN